MEHRELRVQEVARNLPEENRNYASYDWKATRGRNVPVWTVAEPPAPPHPPQEDKQAEAGSRTPRVLAPPRGRLAHCLRGKQSGSQAGRDRESSSVPTSTKKATELLDALLEIIASGRRENSTRHPILWERRPIRAHPVPVLSCGDVTRAKQENES